MFQSTHPRGVRPGNWFVTIRSTSFNQRTREGCDSERAPIRPFAIVFQSTHPRGVRLLLPSARRQRKSFNPRTREGCDLTPFADLAIQLGFNPRTREGCDSIKVSPFLVDRFQSTHPRGVRRQADAVKAEIMKFQSTHPRGVRLIVKI